MSATITLDDVLAERLRVQAHTRQLSLEQWAMTILANACERPQAQQTWTDLNAQLQDATAKVFEPADQERLAHVHAEPSPSDDRCATLAASTADAAMSDKNTVALYKIGDQVRLRFGSRLIGTVSEVDEPVSPEGHVKYRIRIPMDPEPLWVPVRQDDVEKV
jgi:hypothetical protein